MIGFNSIAGAINNTWQSAMKGAANWIDDRFGDIPFVSNPYRPKNTGEGTTSPTPKPDPPKPDTSKASNDWARESAALNAQLAALQQQIARQPRLPDFDILSSWNRAKQTATQAVTPLYNKKLNIFLEGQGIKKQTKTKERDLSKENNQIGLNNSLQDSSISRTRTGEDLANVLASIGQNRDDFLVDDAQAFDVARRALMEETAAGGATDTGLGQQAIGQQQDDRNRSSDRQMNEFRNQEAAKQLLATRTIDDLALSDTRSKQKKGQDDKAVDIDFEGYMSSLANEEKGFRLQNELDQALAIAQQTQTYQQQDVAQFIAGLSGQGWRAQDIALAKQVYG